MGRKLPPRLRDRRIAVLAERQYGVVSRSQLLALGLSEETIDHWLDRGRLRRVHRGVYAVGHPALTEGGIWMAGVLAVPGSVLSHRSAAQLWRLRDKGPNRPEVTAPHRARKPSLTCHKSSLDPDEIARHRGIPVTTVARTLTDLAAMIGRDELGRAFDRAELARRLDVEEVRALMRRRPGRRGAVALRAVLAARDPDPPFTRSDLEDLFLALVRRERLPRPRVNALVEGLEVDFSWPVARLVVELDSHAHHGGLAAFERDRARDRRLAAAGWRVVRVTWRQLVDAPAAVTRDLRALHA